ncbi:MAG: ABC transporter ATP-binding protein [Firmicutes bacterium]|nr:ABC transporter ATP-binding protein [Bacillota bacterium]
MELLRLTQVGKKYVKGKLEVDALLSVDLTIDKGEFLAVVGPSGSGKTTLLNIIGCLDTASSGSVRYNGQELGKMDEKALSDYRKENLGFVFQSYNLIPVLTVRENVELPLVIEKKIPSREIRSKVEKIVAQVGLSDKLDRYPAELSGGQEQRVAIARALVKEPLLVLADEPTANLDSNTAGEIIELMRRINRENQTTFVFSTHDFLVQKHAARIVTLKDGKIASDERRA